MHYPPGESYMKNNYITNISYMRIFATVSVLYLHTCSTLTDNPGLFILSKNQTSFFRSSYQMMYWAVPVFFMITGMLFLSPDKKITLKQCIEKYSYRILLALFVFGMPFAVLKIMIETHSSSFFNIVLAFKAVIENNSFGHLWYLYTLLGIYLILPFLKKIIDNSKDLEIKFLLIFLFIIDFCFPLLSELLCINIAFELPFKYPLFYVLSGYYFNKNKQWFANKRKLIAGFIIACILFIWGGKLYGFSPRCMDGIYQSIDSFFICFNFYIFSYRQVSCIRKSVEN